MSKVGYLKYGIIMSVAFVVSVIYNACGGPVAFDASPEAKERFANNDNSSSEEQSIAEPRIVINNDATYTMDLQVNLSLRPDGPADEMLISNDSDCLSGDWETFQENKSWSLAQSNREVSVYAKYRTLEGEETACVQDSIIHDNISPLVEFTQRPATLWVNEQNLNIAYNVTDEGSGVAATECKKNELETYKACGQVISYFSMAENKDYMVMVRARDHAGNMSEPKQVNWRPDRTPPSVIINTAPAAITADLTPNFAFSGQDDGSGVKSFQCLLDNQTAYSACLSSFELSNLADGTHSLSVRAIDGVGLISQPVMHTWVQDTSAPTIQFTSTPKSVTNSADADFAFAGINSSQGIVSYRCSIDGGSFASCSSPHSLSSLADGRHNFSVIGTDGAGNNSSAITYGWLIDTQAPSLSIVESPDKETANQMARFAFSAQDNMGGSGVERIECGLDGGSFVTCVEVMDFSDLSPGSHSMRARSIDRAGNVSAVASYSWMIDIQGPTVSITNKPPAVTPMADATFAFVASDGAGSGVASIQCRVDGADFQDCSSPSTFNDLSNGQHSFSVRAIDNVGNMSSVSSYSWHVDLEGPNVAFVMQPSDTVFIGTDAVIRFTADDGAGSGVSRFECQLNGVSQSCAGDQEIRIPATSVAEFEFIVIAFDQVGNSSQISTRWSTTFEVIPHIAMLEVSDDRPVDILFVIDDSGSMDFERSSLASRFSGFLNKVDGLDWQIGVITTNVYNNQANKQGRFVKFQAESFGLSGVYILDSSMDAGTAQSIFGQTVQAIPSGSGSGAEMGIWASKLAIDRALDSSGSTVNEPNRQFFRDGADLAIVVLSDEDENSNGTSVKMQPADFVQYVSSSFGQKNFTWHSIIVRPGDNNCRLDNQGGAPQYYGVKYDELSRLTGFGQAGGAIIGSVCERDYTTQLADIGQSVKDMQKTISLECAPVDEDGDGQVEISVRFAELGSSSFQAYSGSFQLQGLKLVFDDLLPPGDYRVNYSCVK
ncbi:MAG: hypothetical protein KDD33_02570 [Bdellovibrionales bacterium]|nr:hypothetical protein [Bdellovibrionales bacterium]